MIVFDTTTTPDEYRPSEFCQLGGGVQARVAGPPLSLDAGGIICTGRLLCPQPPPLLIPQLQPIMTAVITIAEIARPQAIADPEERTGVALGKGSIRLA